MIGTRSRSIAQSTAQPIAGAGPGNRPKLSRCEPLPNAMETNAVRRPSLALMIQDGRHRRVLPLGKNFYSVGRDRDRDICLSSPEISRYHASLIWSGDRYVIVDGDFRDTPSGQGLRLNGQAITESPLAPNDIVTLTEHTWVKLIAGRAQNVVGGAQTADPEPPSSDLLSAFPDLMVKFDGDGRIVEFKNSIDSHLPQISGRHIGGSVAECFTPNFAIKLFNYSQLAASRQTMQSFEASLAIGSQPVLCEVRLVTAGVRHRVAIIRNITERKILEQTLLSGAMRDDLTGLPNRSLFMQKVAQSVALKKAHSDYNFALLFVDLDRFKQVNDSLGHLVGDQLLVETARQLRAILRSQDTVARLGGDEFGLLLPDIDSITDAIEVANRIQASLGQPLQLENHAVFPSASIGIAFSQRGYDSLEAMLKDADSAMYQAKAGGRSRYVVFDSEPDQTPDPTSDQF